MGPRLLAKLATIGALLWVVPGHAYAETLLTAYHEAVARDPVLAQARAQLAEDRAGEPLARSALYPHLGAAASVGENRAHVTGIGLPILTDYLSDTYSLTLTQPLFNGQALSAMDIADSQVRQGEAALAAAQQNLIVAVTRAYFGVLQAQALARVARHQHHLLVGLYRQAKAFLAVGTGDVIAVQEARADCDAATASLILAQNAVAVARQQLKQLTHFPVTALWDVGRIQPQLPHPDRMEPWVAMALRNQPLLRQAKADLKTAQAAVRYHERAGWPTLTIQMEAQRGLGELLPGVEVNQMGASINLFFPIYQGGGISAATGQAQAAVSVSQNRLRHVRDDIRLQTETAFLNMQTSVAQMQASLQALTAARISLAGTRKGYQVGTRSFIDVLTVATQYAAAERSYEVALYNQIMARVELKAAVGVLKPRDVLAINALLTDRPHKGSIGAAQRFTKSQASRLERP